MHQSITEVSFNLQVPEFKMKPRSKELIELVIQTYANCKDIKKTAKKVDLGPYVVASILGIPRESAFKGRFKFSGEAAEAVIADYKAGMSWKALKEKYGASDYSMRETVRRAGIKLRDHGGPRRRVTDAEASEIVRLYSEAGFSQTAIATKLRCGQTVVSKVLISAGLRSKGRASGPDHGSWKGGIVERDGYLLEMIPHDHPMVSMRTRNGYVMQHRLVMAMHLQRPLNSHETVHHINGDRSDNRIENLQLRKGRHGNGVVMQCRCCGSQDIETVKIK